ncbi:hypothetical protein BJ322DRAFT_1110468 [Thelephora terrestris]|uniref:Uncharacterized protein n=1 Tax=Thelephora terrestris TaxID=56493 RepID=A0A9P6HAF9_9AGAM|nr:hypothetical protein BJ322DRAFT_1110468 [Thelephora terrestris]
MKIFTTNHSSLGRIVLGVGAFSLLSFVEADFAQCVSGWEWSYNSQGLNPCEIAGSLQAPCLGYSAYVLGPIGNGSNYVTPQANDTAAQNCGCNTVIYSLYSACTLCQFNTSTTPLTWAFWSEFCPKVYVTQYPLAIPFNASVPHWAFLNDTNPSFDPVLAQSAGRDPEATPTSPSTVPPSSTSTSHVSGNPAVSTGTNGSPLNPTPTTTTTTTAGGGGGHKNNTGAIAGGVVGGIIGLAALGALAFFLKRRSANDPNRIPGSSDMTYNLASGQQFADPPKLYDPSDPSTFPSPQSAGDSSNSGGYTTSPYQAGRYNGAPEI